MPTRVVHLINSLHALGGAERLVGTIAKLGSQRPLQVVTLWNASPSVASELPAGTIETVSLLPFSIAALTKARSMIARADVVHVHLSPAQFIGAFIRRPKLFTQHNSWNGRRALPCVQWLDRLLYGRYDRVVGVSDAVTRNVGLWASGDPDRYVTVSNGIELGHFDAPPRAWTARLRDGTVRVGMAARFCANKDHATLLRALALLPPRFELHFAGTGNLEAEARVRAGDLGVEERTRFHGAVTSMRDFYGMIDLYVQSSHHDGFSLVAAEAMASGVPLLATDIPGLSDTIGSRDQCVAPRDAPALATAIMAAVLDQRRYEAWAQRGKRQALLFDASRMVTDYEALYACLAADAPRSSTSPNVAAADPCDIFLDGPMPD
ncbi:MAG TPA: glycosyltransferase [Sphingobium sp.]|nr:glycosyltransferase [Sphingobium sp.]